MLELEGINYWAVVVTWFISVVIGAFWYSPAGFGKQWAKLTGVNHLKMPEREATKVIGFITLAAAVQAIVLAVVVNSLGTTSFTDGLLVGAVLWLGLAGATTVGNALYLRFGWKFWWLNGSYYLLTFVLNAAILAVWR